MTATMPQAAILGCGYELPVHYRTSAPSSHGSMDRSRNPQGIYQADMFRGLDRRYHLDGDESAVGLTVGACRKALDSAETAADQIDRLYGYVSVPTYYAPNDLYLVHRDLDLPEETMVVPVNGDFTNYLLALVQAGEAVMSGRATRCLVAVGHDWTRHVDYTQGHAISVSDAAGAAVVGPGDEYVLLDQMSATYGRYFHTMTLGTRAMARDELSGRLWLPLDRHSRPSPTVEINQTGVELLGSLYKDAVPEMVMALLARNGVRADQTALITHQGIRVLLDHWADRIQPKEYLETLSPFGNMIISTYAVNLAYFFRRITADYLVLAGIGPGSHVTAVLVRV